MRILLLIVAIILAPFGCATTFPAAMNIARVAVKGTGKVIVEPALFNMCEKVAKKCRADGISSVDVCKPDVECRAKIKAYEAAAKAVEDSAATLNRLWHDLVKSGVIK